KLDDAMREYCLFLAIYERLTQKEPANVEWRRSLSVAYNKVGLVKLSQNSPDAALKSFEKSLGVRQQLLEQDPSSAIAQRDVSVGHVTVAEALRFISRFADALEHLRK